MKLIFSMPAVPSATPAHENSAWIGPPHSSSAVSMLALSRRSRLIALSPARVTGAKSITTTSAPRSCTSSATAAPMPVAPPTTSARLPSYLNASAFITCSCRRCESETSSTSFSPIARPLAPSPSRGAEAADQAGGGAVGIELAGHQVARTHPAPTRPLPEREVGAGRAGCRRHHLHPLERLLHTAGRQRVGVGERVQEHGGEVAIDHGRAVLRTTTGLGLEPVEELLA